MAKETTKEIIKLYNGEVEIVFYPESHQYRINNKRIGSVTGITGQIDKSRPLMIWAEKLSREILQDNLGKKLTEEIIENAVTQHRQKKEEACDTGSIVHDWCEKYARYKINLYTKIEGDEKPIYPQEEEAMNGILAFLKWEADNNVEWLEVETMVYSKKYDYVGRFDAIASVNGIKTLIDFKTSKAIYPEQHLQVAGYQIAYKEERKEDLQGLLLHLNKETGEFENVKVKECKEGFIALVILNNTLKELRKQ